MSLEDFHLLDMEPNNNSIITRYCLKVHHQQGAQWNHSNQTLNSFSVKITHIIK